MSRFFALLCVVGFFLPWAGMGGGAFSLSFSGFDLAKLAFESGAHLKGAALGAIPALAALALLSDDTKLHAVTGIYTIVFVAYCAFKITTGISEVTEDPMMMEMFGGTNAAQVVDPWGAVLEFVKIGMPMTFVAPIFQLLSRSGPSKTPPMPVAGSGV